jgi:hypothetical protein
MKICRYGCIDSGAETAGYKAFKEKLHPISAMRKWKKSKKNSLWIKAALGAYAKLSGCKTNIEIKTFVHQLLEQKSRW